MLIKSRFGIIRLSNKERVIMSTRLEELEKELKLLKEIEAVKSQPKKVTIEKTSKDIKANLIVSALLWPIGYGLGFMASAVSVNLAGILFVAAPLPFIYAKCEEYWHHG